jgi:hypothetical protein
MTLNAYLLFEVTFTGDLAAGFFCLNPVLALIRSKKEEYQCGNINLE